MFLLVFIVNVYLVELDQLSQNKKRNRLSLEGVNYLLLNSYFKSNSNSDTFIVDI